MKKHLKLFALLCIISINGFAQSDKNLNGKWTLEFTNKDIGKTNLIMEFEATDSTFIAFTRKKADKVILGGLTSALGRTFTSSFKEGSLLRIINGKVKTSNDTTKLTGLFTSPMGNYYFEANLINDQLNGVLLNRTRANRGSLIGKKGVQKLPLEDYPTLINSALVVAKEKIFKPNIIQTKDWTTFEEKITDVATKVEDDLEMVFAFFYYAGKLPISHFAFLKTDDIDTDRSSKNGQVILEEKSVDTAVLTINSFGGSAAEINEKFGTINQKGYKNLIVDLRENSGGTIEAGMAFASNIADSVFFGGVFLTNKWFGKHSEMPSATDYTTFSSFSEANFDLIIKGIHQTDGMMLTVIPNQNTYKGKIYILTSKTTGSTCEPIVYALKQRKLATIIGETTAGAMLNGEYFALEKGFKIIVPTADYYTADDYRIDQKGVKPDIETKKEKALTHVLTELIK